jgi:hypothetical protein
MSGRRGAPFLPQIAVVTGVSSAFSLACSRDGCHCRTRKIHMQKYILILANAIALGTACAATQPVDHDRNYEHEEENQRYTCVMHPDVVMKHPGKCWKCGMKLVPLKASKRPTPNAQHRTSNSEMHYMHMSMQSSVNLADPMGRESSGTAWVPDSTPMYGKMFMFGDDMLMLHGAIFPRYTNVSTRRGDDRIDAPNWIMAMFSSPIAGLGENTQLGLRAMMSLDPLTEGGRGYPLLFQTGESWNGRSLHDRQHPHDLFDELSFSVSQKLGAEFSGYFYFAYPGEPALGPPTFMHRLSAMDDPDAPIGHHWQDSTHVTFGVATAGLQWFRYGGMKIEGSAFTGREPDENRYDFDRPRFDSLSGRISWNATQNLALQISHGYIKSPEALEPDVDRHRTTASAIYNQPLGRDSNWATTFVWGRNNDSGEKTQSFLVETNYQRGRDTVYGRWERVEKSGRELVLARSDQGEIFPVNAATIGYVRDLSHGSGIDVGLGGQVTINSWPNDLDRYYGSSPGYAFELFLRVRPSLHVDAAMQDMDEMK